MSGSDASIYGLIRPYDAGPGPLETYGKVAQIRNLMGQGQLQDLQTQKLSRDLSEEQQVRDLFSKYPDGKVPIGELFAASPTHALTFQKSALDIEKAKGDIGKTSLESQALQLKQIRDIAAQVSSDADMPAAREAAARVVGPDRVGQLPFFNAPFTPENKLRAITTADEHFKQLEAQRGRDVTMRGQDQPVWDSERGVFVTRPTQSRPGAPASSPSSTAITPTGLPPSPTAQQRITNNEGKIRDDFTNASKDFVKVRDAHQRVIESAKDPSAAGDLALVFNYMKVLDPGSTVREGEFATAQNSGGVADLIRARYNKVLSGERLSDHVRADFVDRSGRLYNAAESNQATLEGHYTDIAKRSGADPQNVVLPLRVTKDKPNVKQSGPNPTDLSNDELLRELSK